MAKNPDEKITVVFTRRQAEYILDMLEMFSLHTSGAEFSAKRILMKALGVWKEKRNET